MVGLADFNKEVCFCFLRLLPLETTGLVLQRLLELTCRHEVAKPYFSCQRTLLRIAASQGGSFSTHGKARSPGLIQRGARCLALCRDGKSAANASVGLKRKKGCCRQQMSPCNAPLRPHPRLMRRCRRKSMAEPWKTPIPTLSMANAKVSKSIHDRPARTTPPTMCKGLC